eukprot:750278-Hanusia_phi.AAC.1
MATQVSCSSSSSSSSSSFLLETNQHRLSSSALGPHRAPRRTSALRSVVTSSTFSVTINDVSQLFAALSHEPSTLPR